MLFVRYCVRWFAGGAGLASLLLALGSCSALQKTALDSVSESVSEHVMSTDLTARYPRPAGPASAATKSPATKIYPGQAESLYGGGQDGDQETAAASLPDGATPHGNDRFDLNFKNADVAAVAKVLLGDVLKLTYSIDPRVQGTINLSSGRPVAKSDVLPLFENTLKLVNADLVEQGNLYKVVPSSEAVGRGQVNSGTKVTTGYGLSVLPLHYISAESVLRAVDSFAARPGTIRVDHSRNLLLVRGSSTDRKTVIQAALALDVDWMRGQSVGIFPVRNATPKSIISELHNIFQAGKNGSGADIVRFQPIERLNAVLAVAQSRKEIRRVRIWISRLDRADYNNTTVRVYHLRYGDAKVMSNILRQVFTGQATEATGSSDLSQITPGSSVRRVSNAGTPQPSSANPSNSGTFFTSANDEIKPSSANPGAAAAPNLAGTNIAALSNASGNGTPLLKNVRITADVANNSLLIYASREQYKIIERAIYELDRAPLQVAIDVTVAEVTLKGKLQYGVQFYLHDLTSKPGSIGFGLSSILQRQIPGANLVLGDNADPRVVLNALKAVTDVRVLSSPAVVVLDNQTATLQVGDEVPVTTQQAQDVTTPNAPIVNSIQMTNTGVILKVKPRINANGVVTLDVNQEVSSVVPQQTATTQAGSTDSGATNIASTSLTPTISKRMIQSKIAVASGQTVLLAGMIGTEEQKNKQGIPILSDLKGVGKLFSTIDTTKNRTELIVFIRPQIIRNSVDAQLVAEELRSKMAVMAREAIRHNGADSHMVRFSH